jgi:hypothetical protein
MGDLIATSARRVVTNKLHQAYQTAGKKDRGQILDQVVAMTGLARVSARRLPAGPILPDPARPRQADRRAYGEETPILGRRAQAADSLSGA